MNDMPIRAPNKGLVFDEAIQVRDCKDPENVRKVAFI
jgi:hypothetical protein